MSAAFRCRLSEFSSSTAREKLGDLIMAGADAGFANHFHKQTKAWEKELQVLESAIAELRASVPHSGDWWLLLEYEIPRRQRRPDVILLAGELILVLEFKVDGTQFLSADEWQVQSYALDLRDFHAASHERMIVPILVVTDAPDLGEAQVMEIIPDSDHIGVQKANAKGLAGCVRAIEMMLKRDNGKPIDGEAWDNSSYRPTPTIIEAAEALFANKQIADISHKFATNLDETSDAIVAAVQAAQLQGRRTICFVTGIPGAGKTLAGLNAVHNPALRRDGRPAAMFLSGNGPLVKIIREALTRDQRRAGIPKKEAARRAATLIANVHRFLVDHGVKKNAQSPPENAIIFDEAQRAWDAKAVEKKHEMFQSEPSIILDIMERVPEWCCIVALVGEGQEINKGEAGIAEWGRALNSRSHSWRVLTSKELLSESRPVGSRLFDVPGSHIEVVPTASLHLSVSTRSPRAQRIGQWVDDLLHNRVGQAESVPQPSKEFPIVITRELTLARQWLRERAESKQRAGLLASSGALRLRAEGIEVSSGFRKGYSYTDWFLSGSKDSRSSGQLEVAATEFECQGLEVDWAGICWGGDYVIDPETGIWWSRKFRGKKWQNVKGQVERQFLVNKYRVLLTRARKGMVLWVPRGNAKDVTQDPKLFDATAAYLEGAGVPAVGATG